MEMALAWIVFLGLGVGCLALSWAWMAPRLPRGVRLAILALVAVLSVLTALGVLTFRPGHPDLGIQDSHHAMDVSQTAFGWIMLLAQVWIALAGLVAGLASVGRARKLDAGLLGAGIYLAVVGLSLYLMLGGRSTIEAPLLVFVGAAVATAAASKLAGLARWVSVVLGLSLGFAVMLVAEALRGPGGQGGGLATAPSEVLALTIVGAMVLLVVGVRFVRSQDAVLARPLMLAVAGIAITTALIALRGTNEWAPEQPYSTSRALYGFPFTLLIVACSLIIVELCAGKKESKEVVQPRPLRAWPLAACLAILLVLLAAWRPASEACASASYGPDASSGAAGGTGSDPSSGVPAPRSAPVVADFDKVCLNRSPGLSQLSYTTVPTCKWAQVDPGYPVVQASGTLREMLLSSEDSPWLHTLSSHDLGLNVAVDPAYHWLELGGGPPGSLLHVEIEDGGFPPGYRPVVGDHVTVVGRWVYDCGHDPKTEVHPASVVADEHDEWRADAIGGAQRVRAVRIWMNSKPGVVPVPLEPFDMLVAFPSPAAGKMPDVQVVGGNAQEVRWTVAEGQAAIHITPRDDHGREYFELLLGYRDAAPATLPATYRVTFDQLFVRDNLQLAARNTTGLPGGFFRQLGFSYTGYWFMQAIVGHSWRSLLDGNPVGSGQSYSLAYVTPVSITAPGDEHLNFAVTGYVDNDPSAGVELASGSVGGEAVLRWDAGSLDDLCCGKVHSFTPQHGAWTLTYHVDKETP